MSDSCRLAGDSWEEMSSSAVRIARLKSALATVNHDTRPDPPSQSVTNPRVSCGINLHESKSAPAPRELQASNVEQ
ncbi:MAG: hypothetical protein R3C01_11265 [Planctomycetaceae bacterium]